MSEHRKIQVGEMVTIDGHNVVVTEIHSTILIDGVSFTIFARDMDSAEKIQTEQIKSTRLQNDMLEMLKKAFGGGHFPGSSEIGGI